MNEDIKVIEENLKELCISIIDLLDKLKEDGLIKENEYQKQIYNKKKFLNNIL